jgi:hypothetical protein
MRMAPVTERHPEALGVAPSKGSPYVTETAHGLSITRVLLLIGEANVADLPSIVTELRPTVFCPFCGRQGVYHKRRGSSERVEFFAHGHGQQECVAGDLTSVLHDRTLTHLQNELAALRRELLPLLGRGTCRRCNGRMTVPLLAAGRWEEEVRESIRLQIDQRSRKPDLVCRAQCSNVFLIEVACSHFVDDIRAQDLSATGVPGIEIRATDLFTSVGTVAWTRFQPLPLPLRAFSLETAPREFLICRECRTLTRSENALVSLLEGAERSVGDTELRRRAGAVAPLLGGATGPVHEITRHAIRSPEALRSAGDEWAACAAAARPFDTRKVALAALGWRDFGPWSDQQLHDICNNPFAVSFRELEEASSDSTSLKNVLKRVQSWLRQAQQLVQWINRGGQKHVVDAWAMWLLLDHSRRSGSTAMRLSRLVSQLMERTGLPDRDIQTRLRASGRMDVVQYRRVSWVCLKRWEEGTSAQLLGEWLRRPLLSGTVSTHRLTDDQRAAVEAALRSPLLVLTGGPGTGKTTTVRSIVESTDHPWWVLAPTGKAVGRLIEVFGDRATTVRFNTVASCIRKTTGFEIDGTKRGDGDPALAADRGVIVDEAGCLDATSLARLLTGVKQARRLIFVGDTAQLPSVGAGAVLRDLLTVDAIPKAALTVAHRVGKNIALRQLARQIQSDALDISKLAIEFVASGSDDTLVSDVAHQYGRLCAHVGGHVPVITPFVDTRERLNARLQAQRHGLPLNAKTTTLRVGDPVICRERYWERSVSFHKGESGELIRGSDGVALRTAVGDKPIPRDALSHFALAYALTIHSAQGSEWPWVILAVPERPKSSFVNRQLLYTAVTRSKEGLLVAGSLDTIRRGCGIDTLARRETLLAVELSALLTHPSIIPDAG